MKAGAACRCARGCPRTTPRHASPAPWAETAFCTPVHFENGLCVWIFRLENHGASRAGPPTCANAGCLIAHTGKRASDFKHEGRFRSERGVKNMAAAVPVGSRPEAVFGRPGGDGPCGLLRKQGRPPWNAGRFSKTARIGVPAGCFGNCRPLGMLAFPKPPALTGGVPLSYVRTANFGTWPLGLVPLPLGNASRQRGSGKR